MTEFKMPSLGADMESGILVEWMVKPGDMVHRGDVIAEIETEKGVIEVEIFEEGVVEKLLVEPSRDDLPVGTPLALIRVDEAEGAVASEPAPPPAEVVEQAVVAADHHPMDHHAVTQHEADANNGQRVRISPVARKLAADLGVDTTQIKGTGPRGAISKTDVEQAAERQRAVAEKPAAKPAKPAKPDKEKSEKFQAGMRNAIAAAMSRSNREIPHYYLETHIDMTLAQAWLEAENQRRSIKDRLLMAVVLLKAVARALEVVPALNGYWRNDQHEPQEAIHLGVGIALRKGGLIAPAIHHADQKNWDELMVSLRDLITRTRSGGLRSSEMTDATITVTNLGDLGVEKVYGIIYPPQVALIGFGKIMDTPWAENGLLGVRPVLTATIAGDHRATDGRTGAQFLEALDRSLQEVEKI